jgi:hypothetical protein
METLLGVVPGVVDFVRIYTSHVPIVTHCTSFFTGQRAHQPDGNVDPVSVLLRR